MVNPLYKKGDVVRYIEDMAVVFGREPKIILKSTIIDKSPMKAGYMYDLLDGDKQTKMWERWIELV